MAHFDPAAVDAKAVEEVLRRSAAHLDRIRSTLSVRTSGNIHLFLHADEAAMREATGAQPHWSAFSRGRAIHQPVGFTGAHELAHVVASMLPVPEEAPGPDAFLREGWATAMQKTDRSIDLHDWASVAARTGRLPSPRALRKAWPEGPVTDVHPYHVAGSFCGWLLERVGARKWKRVYVRPDAMRAVTDKTWEAWETQWFRWLLQREVEEDTEIAIRRWLRLPVERGPDELPSSRRRALSLAQEPEAWRSVSRGAWKSGDGVLRGDSRGAGWSVLHTEPEFPRGAGLHVQVRLDTASAVMLRLHRRLVVADEAILSTGGCWVTRRGGGGGFEWREVRLVPGRWTDVVLDSEGGRARLWVDGWLVADVEDGFRDVEGAVGLGVRGGRAEFRKPLVRLPAR
ncbi:MAG: LamG domain-containing protein [Planctomycetota bacterium]